MARLAEAKRPWQARIETGRGTFGDPPAGARRPLDRRELRGSASKKYFDGVPIHRVVPNFVVQDGDPTGTGNGGPGYEIRDEINPVLYLRGTVGMALKRPDTGAASGS